MTTEQIIEECKKRIRKGQTYLDITAFLVEVGVDDNLKPQIFTQLDDERKKYLTKGVDVSIPKLVMGTAGLLYGISVLSKGEFSGRSIFLGSCPVACWRNNVNRRSSENYLQRGPKKTTPGN